MSETETITREDYYKLHGLLALAKQHTDEIDAITRAAASIVGEADDGYGYYGHVSDAVSDSYSADHLLRCMGIEVWPSRPRGERMRTCQNWPVCLAGQLASITQGENG